MATSDVRQKKNKSRVDMEKGERISSLLDTLKSQQNTAIQGQNSTLNQNESSTPSWLSRLWKK